MQYLTKRIDASRAAMGAITGAMLIGLLSVFSVFNNVAHAQLPTPYPSPIQLPTNTSQTSNPPPALLQTLKTGITVFSLAQIPIRNLPALPGAQVVYLDQITNLEETLSQGLPGNEAEATAIVKQRIAQIQARAGGAGGMKQMFTQSANALVVAHQLGIDRVPAVVFDSRFVIYGVADMNEARDIHQRWLASNAAKRGQP